MCHKVGSENAHEAGEQHQIRLKGVNFSDQRPIKGCPIGKLAVVKGTGLDAGVAGAYQSIGLGLVGNDCDDLGWRVGAGEIVDQCLQVGA